MVVIKRSVMKTMIKCCGHATEV